jgi:hypothetical protein
MRALNWCEKSLHNRTSNSSYCQQPIHIPGHRTATDESVRRMQAMTTKHAHAWVATGGGLGRNPRRLWRRRTGCWGASGSGWELGQVHRYLYIFSSSLFNTEQSPVLYSLNSETIQWPIFDESLNIHLNSNLHKLTLIYYQLDETNPALPLDFPYGLRSKRSNFGQL